MDKLVILLLFAVLIFIAFLISKWREESPYAGRGMDNLPKEYLDELKKILSPFATAFTKELIKQAYESIQGDYKAYLQGERSDYLETMFEDKYKETPRDTCFAICFILESTRVPYDYEEKQAWRDLNKRLGERIAGVYDFCIDNSISFPHGIVRHSRQAKYAIQEYSKHGYSQTIQN